MLIVYFNGAEIIKKIYTLFYRHIFKLRRDDDKPSAYRRLSEDNQYSDLQVNFSR